MNSYLQHWSDVWNVIRLLSLYITSAADHDLREATHAKVCILGLAFCYSRISTLTDPLQTSTTCLNSLLWNILCHSLFSFQVGKLLRQDADGSLLGPIGELQWDASKNEGHLISSMPVIRWPSFFDTNTFPSPRNTNRENTQWFSWLESWLLVFRLGVGGEWF